MPLYREDLDGRRGACAVPGCHEDHEDEDLWIHANCHLSSPTWARYRGDVLTIQCARCEQDVVSFVIASRDSEPPT